MTVKEYSDRLEFRLKSRDDIDAFSSFEHKHAEWLRVVGRLALLVPIEGKPEEVTFAVSGGQVLHQGGQLDVLGPLAGQFETADLNTWLSLAVARLSKGAQIDGTLEAFKLQNPEQGEFLIFTEAALPALAAAVRSQVLRQPLAGLQIRTPLVTKSHEGVGCIVDPLSAAKGKALTLTVKPGNVVVPCTGQPALDQALAAIQLDSLFGPQAANLPRWECSCSTARTFALWALDAPLRSTIARTLLDGAPVVGEEQVSKFLQRAKQDEDDLLRDRLKALHEARDLFRSEVFELIADIQKLRAEVGALMGSDLFHNLVAVAVAISGLELANAPQDVTLGAALAVGILFMFAGFVKAEVNRREFRRLLKFAQQVSVLPASAAVPDFRDWFKEYHNKSISEFYALYLAGTMAAALPAMVVASYWAWQSSLGGEPWALTVVLATSFGVYTAVFFFQSPGKQLRI